jgi:hypothetical protein
MLFQSKRDRIIVNLNLQFAAGFDLLFCKEWPGKAKGAWERTAPKRPVSDTVATAN